MKWSMRWLIYFQEGLQNLFSAKLRSILALTGILVGTASVVAMMTGGLLATHEALKQFETLGIDLLAVTMGASADEQQNKLSLQQANDIVKTDSHILMVAPYLQLYTPMQFNGHPLDASVLGVTENFSHIAQLKMSQGRFISDLDHHASFCVIGDEVYQQIKKVTLMNPIGQQIQLGQDIYTIVGIANPWPDNSFVNASINKTVMLPIETALQTSQYAAISNVLLKLSSHVSNESVQANVENYLKQTIPGKQYFFRSAKELVKSMEKQNAIFTDFLGLIGGVSLLVGGIGVMNIMLVSVVERRREIGIRLAVGARRRDIRLLFLVEAVTLSMTGGFLGVILGIVIAWFVALYSHWEFTVFLLPPLVGFIVSAATGVFFGFYPAHQASCLDPVMALRSD